MLRVLRKSVLTAMRISTEVRVVALGGAEALYHQKLVPKRAKLFCACGPILSTVKRLLRRNNAELPKRITQPSAEKLQQLGRQSAERCTLSYSAESREKCSLVAGLSSTNIVSNVERQKLHIKRTVFANDVTAGWLCVPDLKRRQRKWFPLPHIKCSWPPASLKLSLILALTRTTRRGALPRTVRCMALCFMLAAAPAWAQTPGFVSEASNNSILSNAVGTKANSTCSTDAYCEWYVENALGGNLGIVPFQYSSSPSSTPSVADDKSDSYSCVAASSASSSKLVDVCYAPNLTSGARGVTISFGAAVTQVTAKAAMFYNIATSSPLDASSSAVGSSSTTVNAVSVTTNYANDLIYVYVCRTGTPLSTSAFVAGSGFTLGTTDYHDGCASEWEVDTGTGSITPTMTLGGASTYIEYVLAFKAATAGTAPSGWYADRMMSWSSPTAQTATSWPFQFPSSGNLLFSASSCGGAGPMEETGITDSTNTWTSAGAVNVTGGVAATSEFYVANAASDPAGTLTATTSGTGDCTFTFYDFTGAPSAPILTHDSYSGDITSTGSTFPITTTFRLNSTASGLTIAVGGEYDNTSISVASPSPCYFDAATYGGEALNGPEPLWENNPWGHCYTSTFGAQSWTFGLTNSAQDVENWVADLTGFSASGGTEILHSTSAQGTSSATLAITIPSTTSANLLVAAIGSYNSTARTVSKVCLDGTTCATANKFTQATSAAANDAGSATDIWYLLSAPSGKTTMTITYSASASNVEAMYYEVQNPSGSSWALDTSSGNNATGSVSGGLATGAAITTTGGTDFMAAIVGVSNAVTANPEIGNEFTNPGVIFSNTSDAATSLLTTSAAAHTPVWSDASGTFATSTAAFKFTTAYTASPSESNIASDSLRRTAAFGRSDSESNTASDAIARLAGFSRGDSESNTASDSIARLGVFSRGESESNIAMDAIARLAGFGRGPAETNTASDTIARQVRFGRGDSESNTTSDAVARLAGFGRGPAETNTASDAIARQASFGRGDTESNIASDAIARQVRFGRGDSESNTTSDAVARLAGFGRGPAETNTASDAIARQASFGRGESESNPSTDGISRLASFGRGDTESNPASDSIARAAAFGRSAGETNIASDTLASLETVPRTYGAALYETNSTSDTIARLVICGRGESESNPASDAVARAAAYGREDFETLSVSDSLARVFGAVRGETESLATSDNLTRIFAALRGDMETLVFSDAIVGLRSHSLTVLPRHDFAVPGQTKSGAAPGQAKTGAEAGRTKTGTAPVN